MYIHYASFLSLLKFGAASIRCERERGKERIAEKEREREKERLRKQER